MNKAPEQECILIFDFGSQYGQLIARRVREQNVFCQIVRHGLSAERVRALKPRIPRERSPIDELRGQRERPARRDARSRGRRVQGAPANP